MTLFQTNAIAWSKWTSQFQARMPNTAPTIFQANTVMASLDCRTGWSDRDRGTSRDATPPTPPGIRVRTTAVRSS
ncbi:hypothetical protein ACVWWK_003376 [Bradyrhizobium sp. LB9.1b]